MWIKALMYYNNEQFLRYVIQLVYIVCIDYYMKVDALPTGYEITNVVFISKYDTTLPDVIVEIECYER